MNQAKRCRRYRRRPQRLAALAAHRAQIPIHNSEGDSVQARWIPTALWHAKRFHVVQNWGWRIPFAPTDKLFKTLQRAATEYVTSLFASLTPLVMILVCLNVSFSLQSLYAD